MPAKRRSFYHRKMRREKLEPSATVFVRTIQGLPATAMNFHVIKVEVPEWHTELVEGPKPHGRLLAVVLSLRSARLGTSAFCDII